MNEALLLVRRATIKWLKDNQCSCSSCHELRIALEELRIQEAHSMQDETWKVEVMNIHDKTVISTSQTKDYPQCKLDYGKWCLYSVTVYPALREVSVHVTPNERAENDV